MIARLHLVALALEPLEEAVDAVPVAAVALDTSASLRRASCADRHVDGHARAPARGAAARAGSARPHGVANGATAPPASVRDGSGITRSRSSAGTRPKPSQVSQAPSALLKEKSAGVGAGKRRPQRVAGEALAR